MEMHDEIAQLDARIAEVHAGILSRVEERIAPLMVSRWRATVSARALEAAPAPASAPVARRAIPPAKARFGSTSPARRLVVSRLAAKRVEGVPEGKLLRSGTHWGLSPKALCAAWYHLHERGLVTQDAATGLLRLSDGEAGDAAVAYFTGRLPSKLADTADAIVSLLRVKAPGGMARKAILDVLRPSGFTGIHVTKALSSMRATGRVTLSGHPQTWFLAGE